jgi:hypothetical protein
MHTSRTGNGAADKPKTRLKRALAAGRTLTYGRRKRELTNADLAELLAREAEQARPPVSRALRRASRRAFLWPEEASHLLNGNRSLTELQSIGPYLDKLIRSWFADAPIVPAPPTVRTGFLTLTEAQTILEENPGWLKGQCCPN